VLLNAHRQGDSRVFNRLIEIVYADLYRDAVPCVPSRGTASARASVSARLVAAPASMPTAMTDATTRVEDLGLGRNRPGSRAS
jgi:hypothetical protein